MLTNISAHFPTLTTERLTLRQPLESDVQEIFLLRSNTDVNKYLNRQPTETVQQAASFIQAVLNNIEKKSSLYWAIVLTAEKKLIGTICLYGFSDDGKKCEIGYELLPNYQGKGMMTEAVKKVVDFAFTTLRLQSIEAFTHKDNQPSTGVLRKLNFEQTAFIDEAAPDLISFSLSNR